MVGGRLLWVPGGTEVASGMVVVAGGEADQQVQQGTERLASQQGL